MKCAGKYFLAVIAIFALYGGYRVTAIYMTDGADYTRSDWLEYKLLTPDEITNAPSFGKVSILKYRPADGSSPQYNQIEYAGRVNTADIYLYLKSLGYSEAYDPVMGNIWLLKNTHKTADVVQTNDSTTLTFMQ